jgi:hypothetical protein
MSDKSGCQVDILPSYLRIVSGNGMLRVLEQSTYHVLETTSLKYFERFPPYPHQTRMPLKGKSQGEHQLSEFMIYCFSS